MVQGLRLLAFTAEGPGSLSGQETRTSQATSNIYECLRFYTHFRIGVSSQSWPGKGIIVIKEQSRKSGGRREEGLERETVKLIFHGHPKCVKRCARCFHI